MQFDLLSPREQLVRTMQRIYDGGMTTLSGGNLSILESDGSMWITPTGIDKGKLVAQDIVHVQADGTPVGHHRPSSELPFHQAIYAMRPDVQAVVHAHPPALVAFSIAGKVPDTNLIPQARDVCGPVGYAPYALPGSADLGTNIANAFAEGFDTVILENHGVAVVGKTLLEAFQRLETLDFCARTQMYAHRLGTFSSLNESEINLFNHREYHLPEFELTAHSSREREIREQIVDTLRRSYQRQLMISTEGVVSARLDGDSFLITPTGHDRNTIDNRDIVLIKDGKREAGKLPSRSVLIHQATYQMHPEVNSIIMAQSPYAMAYAISDEVMNTATIPESYILLRDVPTLEYEQQFGDPGLVAQQISERNPVVLLKNNCLMVVGKSVLGAFDRLEVLEFTTRSLIDATHIGALKPISDDDTEALKGKFLGDG